MAEEKKKLERLAGTWKWIKRAQAVKGQHNQSVNVLLTNLSSSQQTNRLRQQLCLGHSHSQQEEKQEKQKMHGVWKRNQKHLWEPCREYSDSRIGAVSGRKATDTRCIGRIKLLQKGRVLWDG